METSPRISGTVRNGSDSSHRIALRKKNRRKRLFLKQLQRSGTRTLTASNQGPVDLKGMKNWISLGMVEQHTMVWRSGMSEWLPASLIRAEWFNVPVPRESNSHNARAAAMSVCCPHCQTQLSVNAAHAGSVLPCKKCGGKFQMPVPTAQFWRQSATTSISRPE